jgi:antitoxin component of RelBE/YafQ-DinJ toxin-antitoxin module
MNTKLTLSLDKETIEKAKEVSKKNGQSLSKLIEQYLKLLISKEEKPSKYTSISEKLSGIIAEPKEEYKSEKAKHLLKKHA